MQSLREEVELLELLLLGFYSADSIDIDVALRLFKMFLVSPFTTSNIVSL